MIKTKQRFSQYTINESKFAVRISTDYIDYMRKHELGVVSYCFWGFCFAFIWQNNENQTGEQGTRVGEDLKGPGLDSNLGCHIVPL